ncbi:L-asparaginase [Orbus hercynius]|uniref:L-asparaginase n=1 Tax=Orbus hercynius TaxID=593135 RepID=A0A495RC80_9GAMM|nr:asparaginase [Orbus hercynius]RKS84804.1 L-asparaginase [Orbus hercynius]
MDIQKSKQLPKILIITTGGTITMTPDSTGGVVPTLTGNDLVRSVPDIAKYCECEVISFVSKPGASLNWVDLLGLAKLLNEKLADDSIHGAIVVQGTDTIEETAFIFDLLIQSDKPLVVTGAMRSAMMLSADGPANLLAAVIIASSNMQSQGTLVALNNEFHAARYVQKSHTGHLHAFSSPACGPLGCVLEDKICQFVKIERKSPLAMPKNEIASVGIIKAALADDDRLLKNIPALGYQGIVIEAMGAGHLPAHYAPYISEFSNKFPVVLASRVPSGPIFTHSYNFAGSEMDSIRRGAIPSGLLGSVKSRLLLTILLSLNYSPEQIKTEFHERTEY